MIPQLVIEVLGTLRQGVFTPATPGIGTRLGLQDLVIGSHPEQTPSLILQDGTVSRKHAAVVRRDDGWRIQDLDSDNGLVFFPESVSPGRDPQVWMKGERKAEAAIVNSLTVAVGAVVLRFSMA